MRSCTRFSRFSGSASRKRSSIAARRFLIESGVRLRPRLGLCPPARRDSSSRRGSRCVRRRARPCVHRSSGTSVPSSSRPCRSVCTPSDCRTQVGTHCDSRYPAVEAATCARLGYGDRPWHGRPSDRVHRALGLTDDEAGRIVAHPRAATQPPGAGDVLGDVVASTAPTSRRGSTSRRLPTRGTVGARRPGRERRGGRRRRRDRRGHPHREPQPPIGHRAVPGRRHRRRRHPARHLHHGRPTRSR